MQSQNESVTADTTGIDIVTDGLVQHVDLARFIPRHQTIYLSFNQILQICALALIIAIGYSFYGHWEQTVIGKRITRLQLQQTQLIEKINSERLKKMQELASNDAIYAFLKTQRASNTPGFSSYLTAIATACSSGVWLTSIDIKRSNDAAILLGNAYNSYDIMQFMDNLNRDPLFSRSPFFLAKIEKIKKSDSDDQKTPTKLVYNFILRTQAAGPDK